MIVLTINSGSTSVKLAAYAVTSGAAPVCLRQERHEGTADAVPTLQAMMGKLPARPQVVAHRVVHGGTRFAGPTRIDDAVITELAKLSELAPLHNPKALEWIEAARAACGAEAIQLADFDTAFFVGMPRVAAEYALAPQVGVDLGVRRYGFHGLAHRAMWQRWCELHPEFPQGGRVITLQLGGGCSMTAIDHGRPIDTSMGFSPLEGLMMATRSGDIDPAVIPYLQRQLGLSSERIVEILNRESGLVGVSGVDANPAVLLDNDSPRARFALDLYCYRARKCLGAYLAALGGCDGIVFGGGVGEHIPQVRERILGRMGWAGIELDLAANMAAREGEAQLALAHSIKVYVLAVDEERLLVEAAQKVWNSAP